MSVRTRRSAIRPAHYPRLWPVLLLLAAVVLVPTACLLWLMTAAIEAEHAVVRQQLVDAYRLRLGIVRQQLEDHWRARAESLDEIGRDPHGAAVFQRCIEQGLADSVVCYDAQGQLVYPAPSAVASQQEHEFQDQWDEARQLEQTRGDFVAAADAYGRIAEQSSNVDLTARALQGRVRCLVQAGQIQSAIGVVTGELGRDEFRHAVDEQGRLIVANAELMALRLMGDQAEPEFRATADRLRDRLTDYGDPALAAAQRRFLMRELLAIDPETAEFPTLAAEELAGRFVEMDPALPEDSGLHPAGLPDVWQFPSSSGRVVALLHTQSVLDSAQETVAALIPSGEMSVRLLPPDKSPSREAVFQLMMPGGHLPGWQWTLSLEGGGMLSRAAEQRSTFYRWTGTLVIVAVSVLAVLIAQTFRRQLRLTRLKSDLVSTVSHELKTPLASIRLLVDTLLDEPQIEGPKAREYLQLVAKENARLSRLIDNFLTFSRMERGRHAFDFSRVSPAAVVRAVQEALGERFQAPQCRFALEIQPDLPPVLADADALVAAVLNLLDNAYKYSGEDKQIVLRASARDGSVCFEVADNGIGLSPRAARRVFRRFYQVDQRLSREGGGVGLGLSIVEFIVAAHGGTVTVASQPGKGSTFTVAIPVATAGPPAAEGTPS